ncbi:hypothetical protein GGF42_000337 [Coemansia sp. RSA 2424]|nr:hypothetical protein GGF42_000337 [Coemansia sp. RSA 2424]
MSTKAERDRNARIAARQLEAKKKKDEKAAKQAKLDQRLKDSLEVTKAERAKQLNKGIIVDVMNPVQARLAQASKFAAVCVLEYPLPQMKAYQMCRLSDPRLIKTIADSVLIPVIAKVNIGHEIEAAVAAKVGANFIEETEFALDAAPTVYMDKKDVSVPVICTVTTLADCVARLKEGASILRTRNKAAVRAEATLKIITDLVAEIDKYQDKAKWIGYCGLKKDDGLEEADHETYIFEKNLSHFPIFAYGGICTPRDVALMMEMKCRGVFVENSIFASDNPRNRLKSMARAIEVYDKMDEMIKLSMGTGERYT